MPAVCSVWPTFYYYILTYKTCDIACLCFFRPERGADDTCYIALANDIDFGLHWMDITLHYKPFNLPEIAMRCCQVPTALLLPYCITLQPYYAVCVYCERESIVLIPCFSYAQSIAWTACYIILFAFASELFPSTILQANIVLHYKLAFGFLH